jgi:hypothetical protein
MIVTSIEPWLRGTETDVPAVGRAVLHALQLAEEDLQKWCGNLSDAALNARPAGAAPVAFHIRHVARSLDRLLTYAEARDLSEQQMSQLRTEIDPGAAHDELFAELAAALADAAARVRALAGQLRWEDYWSTWRIIRSGMWGRQLLPRRCSE